MVTTFLEPSTEENRHGLRDPPLAGDPIPHRPGRDAQAGRRADLGEPESLEDGAQLCGGHGHGALKIGTTSPCLASRHIVPTLPAWPIVRSQRRRDASAERSGCSKSSRTSCVSWAPARCRVTTRFGRSWPRNAGCGSPWPRWGRPPMRFAPGLVAWARLGNERRRVASCSDLLPWSRVPLRSSCGRSGGPCECSCDWSIRCGRSGRKLTGGTEPEPMGPSAHRNGTHLLERR